MWIRRWLVTSRIYRFHLAAATANRWPRAFSACSTIRNQPHALSKVVLRPYQEECVKRCLEAMKDKPVRMAVSLATGGGKTVILSNLISRAPNLSESANQTMIIAHSKELVEQAARHVTSVYGSQNVEIEMAESHASGHSQITVASIKSLLSKDRLLKFDPSQFKLIIIDEAHHAAARSYLKVLEYFGARTQDTKLNVIGFSATMSRRDGIALNSAFDHLVYHLDFVEMIRAEWLSPVKFTKVYSSADLSQVQENKFGDFRTDQLAAQVNTSLANDLTVNAWLDRAADRKSTLVFCVDLQHVADLTQAFRARGVDARFVSSGTTKFERTKLVEDFRAKRFPVMVNCGVFTEGTDLPSIDCVLLARPTKSRNLLIQMIGRGMRLASGKRDCHVIDMAGTLTHGIANTPTLFGLDPDAVLDHADSLSLMEMKERNDTETANEIEMEKQRLTTESLQDSEPMKPENITYVDYDDYLDLNRDALKDIKLRDLSHLAWVSIHEKKLVLSLGGKGQINVEGNENGTFDVFHAPKFVPTEGVNAGTTIWARRRHVAKDVSSMERAVQAADTCARSIMGPTTLSWKSKWRFEPATTSQLAILNKRRSADKQLHRGQITKGLAADMITKMFNFSKTKQVALQKRMARNVKAAHNEWLKRNAGRDRKLAQLSRLKSQESQLPIK